MAVNKVEVDGEIVLDLTGDTVSPGNLLKNATAHDNSGNLIEGSVVVAPIDPTLTQPGQAADAKATGEGIILAAGITPQMFGAVGDGVADDTDAFEAMLSYDGADSYHIPIGAYRITRPLVYTGGRISMFGDLALHGHLSSGMPTITADVVKNLAKEFSVIYFDTNSGGTLFEAASVFRCVISDIDFVCSAYSCAISADGTNSESIVVDNVSALHVSKGEIRNCGFCGFSGTALNIDQQHGKISSLSFFKCKEAIRLGGNKTFDYRIDDIWMCLCKDGIVCEANVSNNIQFLNIWADQMLRHVMRFPFQTRLRMDSCWFDLIGGNIIKVDTGGLANSHITNCRFSRYALLEGDGAVEVSNIYNSYFHIASDELHSGVQSKPLIKTTGSFKSSVVFAPGRDISTILVPNSRFSNTCNMIYGADGCLTTTTDKELTAANTAADAKAVGDKIIELKNGLSGLEQTVLKDYATHEWVFSQAEDIIIGLTQLSEDVSTKLDYQNPQFLTNEQKVALQTAIGIRPVGEVLF